MAFRPKGRLIYESSDGVPFEDGRAVMVYPLGFRHITKFSGDLTRAIAAILSIEHAKEDVRKLNEEGQLSAAIVAEAVPILLRDCIGIIQDTCVVGEAMQDGEAVEFVAPDEPIALDVLPHWELPTVIEAWIELSFGEDKKVRPWLRAIEKTVGRLTGKKEFSLTSLLSRSSSPSDTTDETSSS